TEALESRNSYRISPASRGAGARPRPVYLSGQTRADLDRDGRRLRTSGERPFRFSAGISRRKRVIHHRRSRRELVDGRSTSWPDSLLSGGRSAADPAG